MFGSVVSSSLRLRAMVVVCAAIVMALGVLSLRKMPVDVYPEILPVTVTVQTEALGLSAAEVEQLITVPIEADLLSGTPWVDVMRSESVPGLSNIELVFRPGTSPMHARQVVQERLTQAHALPNVSKPPAMLQPISSTNRVMLVGLSSRTQSLIDMSVLARWTIRPRLLGVPGVANVSVWGLRERQLQVRVDPEHLRDAHVSLLQVIKTAGNSLWYSPLTFLEASVAGTGGFIETPNQRIGLRHVLPISKAADLAKVPVEGSNLRLDQVASVVEDHQPLIGDGLNDGGQGLLLVVEKLPGANTLKVSDDVIAALNALKPGMGDMQIDTQVYHPASYIRSAIASVSNALLVALLLLTVMMLAVFSSWRAAVVGLVTIPAALLAAALVLALTKTTANMMLFAGLVIALGVILDDVIVFTSGVLQRLRNGNGPSVTKAIVEASSEVRRSLFFATACLLLAAVPFLFLSGESGAFVRPLVVSYGLAILASLLASATLAPALTLMLFGRSGHAGGPSPFARWVASMAEHMPPALPRAVMATVVVAGLLGLALLPLLRVPIAPKFKEFDVMVQWDAMPGTSHAEMNRIMGLVAAELRAIPGVRNVGGHVGRAILADQVVGMNSAELWVNLDPKADYARTMARIEQITHGYPGIDADVMTYLRARFGDVLAHNDEPIRVRVYGQRLDVLEKEAGGIRDALAQVQGIEHPTVHLEDTEPVVEIKVDLDRAKAAGVKPGDVRRSAAALISGMLVGNLFEEQKLFEVVVWGEPRVRYSLESIQNLLVDTPRGGHVRLGDVADVQIVASPNVIERENVARYVDVVADVSGRPIAAVAAEVNNRLAEMVLPLEYRAELLGGFAERVAARQRMIVVAIGAMIGILVLFQAAFSSWPLALGFLVTLPIALGGGLLAAASSEASLSLGALAGLLATLAITIRQGMLLIQRYLDLRAEGVGWGPQLFAQGVRDRAPSILTTALVLGATLLPFAVFGGRPGHEILGPMVQVMLGGLVTGTGYTLCVLPALYARLGAHAAVEVIEDLDAPMTGTPEPQRP